MNLEPLSNNIIIKKIEAETRSSGGLYLAPVATDKPMEGTVLAVGTGKRTINGDLVPMSVKVGDHVIYAKFAGNEFKGLDQNVLIINEDNILAIVREQ